MSTVSYRLMTIPSASTIGTALIPLSEKMCTTSKTLVSSVAVASGKYLSTAAVSPAPLPVPLPPPCREMLRERERSDDRGGGVAVGRAGLGEMGEGFEEVDRVPSGAYQET